MSGRLLPGDSVRPEAVGEARDIRDLFTAHALIAGELAADAAVRASGGHLAELEALHRELLAAALRRDLVPLEEKNHAFHRQINLIAAPKIAWVLGLIARYVPHLFYSQIEGWPATTTEDHSAILAALRAGDRESARSAMADHIIRSGELLAAEFDARSSGGERRKQIDKVAT